LDAETAPQHKTVRNRKTICGFFRFVSRKHVFPMLNGKTAEAGQVRKRGTLSQDLAWYFWKT